MLILLFSSLVSINAQDYIMVPSAHDSKTNTYVVVRSGGKIISKEYSYISNFKGGVAVARDKDMKFGIIDTQGNELCPFIYTNAQEYQNPSSSGAVALCKDGEWGVLDSKGNVIIPFQNKITHFIYDNYICARNSDGKEVLYDLKGKEVIPPVYDEINRSPYISNLNFGSSFVPLIAKKGDKFGGIDFKGRTIIPFEYDEIKYTHDEDKMIVKKGDSWAVINNKNKLIYPYIENEYNIVDDRYALITIYEEDHKREGITFPKSKKVIVYDDIRFNWLSEKSYIFMQDGKAGFLDLKGKEILPPTYKEVYLRDKLAWATDENDMEALLDPMTGKAVTGFEYDMFRESETSVITCKKNGKWGAIDRQGKEVIPFEYDRLYSPSDGLIAASKDKKTGFIDYKGEVKVPFVYSRSSNSFKNGFVAAKRDNVWDIINKDGEIVTTIDKDYSDISHYPYFKHGFQNYFSTLYKSQTGIMDYSGNEILPPIFSEILSRYEDVFVATIRSGGTILVN